METTFWDHLDQLVFTCATVIDRPRGSRHPRYPEIIYPLDYGYLSGTTSADGAGIDLWRGSRLPASLEAILVTVDLLKQDSEIKLMLGCTADETQRVMDFHNTGQMRAILIPRPRKD